MTNSRTFSISFLSRSNSSMVTSGSEARSAMAISNNASSFSTADFDQFRAGAADKVPGPAALPRLLCSYHFGERAVLPPEKEAPPSAGLVECGSPARSAAVFSAFDLDRLFRAERRPNTDLTTHGQKRLASYSTPQVIAACNRKIAPISSVPNPSMNTEMPPNLSRRPARPAAGRGKIQKGVKRAFVMVGRSELTTSEVLKYTHALRLHQGRKIDTKTYRQVHRRLAVIADPAGRSSSIGRPWIWRLRPEHRA
jgi:hypothetical protein